MLVLFGGDDFGYFQVFVGVVLFVVVLGYQFDEGVVQGDIGIGVEY